MVESSYRIMASALSSGQFGWQAARRIGVFAGLFFGLPLVIYVIDGMDDPDITLTEAIRVMTATPLGLLMLFLLALSLVRPTWRRMRALGLPGYLGLTIPLLLLADYPFFITSKAGSMFGFSLNSFARQVPLYVLMAFSAIIAMTVARPPMGDKAGRRLGAVLITALLLAILTLARVAFLIGMATWASIVIPALGPEDAPSWLFITLTQYSYWPHVMSGYICCLFIVLIAWCALLSRRQHASQR